jgi:predicted DNA-binding transcriptional regulator YafY
LLYNHTMNHQKHPQPTERIIHLVLRLYAFERLHTGRVAQEYGVSQKTILRDMQKIGSIIPLRNKRGVYRIDTEQVSHLSGLPSAMLQSFASNAGLSIDCLPSSQGSIPLISFAIAYDGIPKEIAEQIIESIERGCKCRFEYTNNRNERSRRIVSPVKLYTAKGKWYLLAKDDRSGEVRPFDFYKIRAFEPLPSQPVNLTKEEIAEAAQRSSIWQNASAKPFAVRLHVSAYASRYLLEVPLHPSQEIDIPHSDGSHTFLYHITNEMELLPQIKEWIPHIHIMEPAGMRRVLFDDVAKYLDEMKYMDI